MVNSGEVLIKAVMFVERKLLNRSDQKVSGQARGINVTPPRTMRHRLRGTT